MEENRRIVKKCGNKCLGKIILPAAAILAGIIFLFCLDGTRMFRHGFTAEARDYENVGADSILGTYDLSQGTYCVQFTPEKEDLAGFVIYLENDPESNADTGSLKVSLYQESGQLIADSEAKLSGVENEKAYKLQMSASLRTDRSYQLEIEAADYVTAPSLILVDEGFRPEESSENSLLIAYGYADPDFTEVEKVLITLLILGGILLLLPIAGQGWKKETASVKSGHSSVAKALSAAGWVLILVTGLAWNYSFNTLNGNNDTFENFQSDSEALVTQAIEAVQKGIANPSGTGLLKLDTITSVGGSEMTLQTDENWDNGYHRTDPAILLPNSEYTEEYVAAGNSIRFENGEVHEILAVAETDEDWLTVVLDIDCPIQEGELGDLARASVVLTDGTDAPSTVAEPYMSQYGLQGKIFQKLSHCCSDLDMLRLYCALGTAASLLLVSWLIGRKYNRLMGMVFYGVFLLSPWVVNFANNLYWVEFTWFLPMAAGLLCSIKLESRKWRIVSYALVFLTIMVKCLCGYEYISTVMMGTILFLLADLAVAWTQREHNECRLLVRTIFCVGISALLGFAAAICLHAPLKSGGSVIEGIRLIIQEDVLRRTYGADLNAFSSLPDFEQAGLNASAWATLCKYFHFKTEIIAGIDGSLFPLLCLAPIVIFLWEHSRKNMTVAAEKGRADGEQPAGNSESGLFCSREKERKKQYTEETALYILSFLSTISWFVLAKSHSFVHTHMNFVLWYCGFVQICIYIILRYVVEWVRGKREEQET